MYDIAIIGGGPAGLTAGISLAKQGFKTILFEKKAFPVDKACGEGIMPPGVAILKKLGVLDRISAAETSHFDGIHYFTSHHQVAANFSEGPGLAVRRPVLSKALLDIASHTSGLSIEEKTAIKSLPREAKFVIGADGLRSQTRKWLGLDEPINPSKRYGIVRHYAIKPWSQKVEVYWVHGLEAYVAPLGRDQIGISFLWDKTKHHPVNNFLSKFPELTERLSGAQPIGPAQATGPFYRPVKNIFTKQATLIGDAAGYLDPITGEGISLGLNSALLLTEALSQNKGLTWYAKELKKSRRTYMLTTQSLLWGAQHEGLFNWAISFLNKHPKVFQRLLSLNMGS